MAERPARSWIPEGAVRDLRSKYVVVVIIAAIIQPTMGRAPPKREPAYS